MPKKVLIVVDKVKLCYLLKDLLAAEGYCPECIESAENAQQALKVEPSQLIKFNWPSPIINVNEIRRVLQEKANCEVLIVDISTEEIAPVQKKVAPTLPRIVKTKKRQYKAIPTFSLGMWFIRLKQSKQLTLNK